MGQIFLLLISIGLASFGTIWFMRTSNHRRLSYFKKIRGVNNFFYWLFVSNLYFYIYFIFSAIMYNLVIVSSKYAEIIDAPSGRGYYVPEDLAFKYSNFEKGIFISTFIINIYIFIYGYLFKKRYSIQLQISENKNSRIHSFGMILISLIASLISLILLGLLDEFTVSYGG